jgi:hypothetical protein
MAPYTSKYLVAHIQLCAHLNEVADNGLVAGIRCFVQSRVTLSNQHSSGIGMIQLHKHTDIVIEVALIKQGSQFIFILRCVIHHCFDALQVAIFASRPEQHSGSATEMEVNGNWEELTTSVGKEIVLAACLGAIAESVRTLPCCCAITLDYSTCDQRERVTPCLIALIVPQYVNCS